MMEDYLYRIALKKLDGIGGQRARRLADHFGDARKIFEVSKAELAKVEGMSRYLVSKFDRAEALRQAEQELTFIQKEEITPFYYQDEGYPNRLRHCYDAPLLLYGRGKLSLNPRRTVSIVGTRNYTNYGERMTERLVQGLQDFDVSVVSGLAYGIDTIAHRSCIQQGIPTIGVLGHSLDRIYPAQNRKLADEMLECGGLLSEFEQGTKPDRENFPQRNRIVAGMSDVTVVIETKVKGGSMITARLAASYNRDVAAYPGATDQPASSGCNQLIKTNIAALVEGIDDLAYLMGWEKNEQKSHGQKQLFVELSKTERKVFDILQSKRKESIDNLSLSCGIPVSRAAATLLELEFKGVVKSLPGKVYELT